MEKKQRNILLIILAVLLVVFLVLNLIGVLQFYTLKTS